MGHKVTAELKRSPSIPYGERSKSAGLSNELNPNVAKGSTTNTKQASQEAAKSAKRWPFQAVVGPPGATRWPSPRCGCTRRGGRNCRRFVDVAKHKCPKAVSKIGSGRRVSPLPINNLHQRYAVPAAFNDSVVSHTVLECCAKGGIRGCNIQAVYSGLSHAKCDLKCRGHFMKLLGDHQGLPLSTLPRRQRR